MVFRYPGAKTKLAHSILPEIEKTLPSTEGFVDVFAGGGSISIALAKKYPDLSIQMNDLDSTISAFWSLVAAGTASEVERFLEMIAIQPTVERFNRLRATVPLDRVERAYHALFFNRCTFSGIATAGPIGGQAQTSKWTVDCRYNASRLAKGFADLRDLMSGRLQVSNLSFQEVLATNPPHTLYLDPPYFLQGKNLYSVYMQREEHVVLADLLKQKDRWVLSYDVCEEIERLYVGWSNVESIAARYSIDGKKVDWKKKDEYLITSK